ICDYPAVTCALPNTCQTAGVCDPQTGMCVGGNPVVCVAKDACHLPGHCEMKTGLCTEPEAPFGTPCDDGNACTTADTCWQGGCHGTASMICHAKDACHLPGHCDPSTGACDDPVGPDGFECSDGDACTLH